MITIRIGSAYLEQRILNLPVNLENCPEHDDWIKIIVNNKIYNCKSNRTANNNESCRVIITAGQGYGDWINNNYNEGDAIRFNIIRDSVGIIRTLILR
jgi:hypothetical protein